MLDEFRQFKALLYSVRKALENNEMPTKKTCFWLLEQLETKARDIEILNARLISAQNLVDRHDRDLRSLKKKVLEKVTEALEN